MNIPESGVGIIYFSGFETVVESNPELIQVLEIEPQTFWYRSNNGLDSFLYDEEQVGYLKSLNRHILFHGVGYPVGGLIESDPAHLDCLLKMQKQLKPICMSEHMSFNNIEIEGKCTNTNFLLPPLQTREGIDTAVRRIRAYKEHFNVPFSFETGVNYLSPKPWELSDGVFINAIAEEAECNILLDIHNIMANQINGRQNVSEFFKQLSHEKITEIHLAGGFYYKDYYLDAHSGVSGDALIKNFEDIVARLPNLKAIVFEMLPEYLSFQPDGAMTTQLEKMNRVWDRRGSILKRNRVAGSVKSKSGIPATAPTVEEWELTLGMLAIGKEINSPSELAASLQQDKGLEVIRDLIEKFRGSLLVSSLKLTTRYLGIKYGMEQFNELLRQYWKSYSPQLFASDNGLDFGHYLLTRKEIVDEALKDLITYELSSIKSFINNEKMTVELSYHPLEMIKCLENLRLFDELEKGSYAVTITPDLKGFDEINTVFHS